MKDDERRVVVMERSAYLISVNYARTPTYLFIWNRDRR